VQLQRVVRRGHRRRVWHHLLRLEVGCSSHGCCRAPSPSQGAKMA
jgi:hypothetical protein